MKKVINLLLIVFTLLVIVSCKTKKEEKSKKEEIKQEVVKESNKKKVPKTDPLKIIAEAPKGITASTVVDNYFKIIGGANKARKVKTILQKSIVVDNPDDTYEFVTKYMLPNKVYEQTAIKGEVFTKIAFNGKTGYDEYKGERKEYTEQQNDQYSSSKRVIFPDFDYAKGTLKGIADVKGEKCYMIEYKNEKIYYSIDTGLRVVVIETKKDDAGKEKITVRSHTSDYRDVDGLKFPFKINEYRPNMRSVKLKIQEILINKDVTNKDFE